MVTKESLKIFRALFKSLVDDLTEPVNLKMARRRQCLTGNAWEAIRGLGVTVHEYEEAKEILKRSMEVRAGFCELTWIN